jgi:hypothetical protein
MASGNRPRQGPARDRATNGKVSPDEVLRSGVKLLKSEWLLKGLVESVFVVGSILLALALDEWAANRDYAALADQSLGIFEQEILRNRSGLEEVIAFHTGISELLGRMVDSTATQMDLRSVIEGLEVPVLLNTAWETALATGALTHMDVEIVSALSLTYSIQERFAAETRSMRPRLTAVEDLSDAALHQQIHEAYSYTLTLTQGESELLTVFGQALELIREHRGTLGGGMDPRDVAHP